MRVAVFAGRGKTGRAVRDALPDTRALGRDGWDLEGCDAAYLIAPNLHPDEPAYVAEALTVMGQAGVGRVVYHSVASPYVPAMPHHVGKAESEDLVRRSGLAWTILQPGAYLQNLDLTGPAVRVPYDVDAVFGFLDLVDLGAVAATVLLGEGHVGATYELATRQASVRQLAEEAGVSAVRVDDPGTHPWLSAMFGYYDRHGLPAGTHTLRALLA